jgi:hypothetical protein
MCESITHDITAKLQTHKKKVKESIGSGNLQQIVRSYEMIDTNLTGIVTKCETGAPISYTKSKAPRPIF